MAKRTINTDELPAGTIKAMANTIGRLMDQEVYVRRVLEIESSEGVIKALDAVIEGVKPKAKKAAAKAA